MSVEVVEMSLTRDVCLPRVDDRFPWGGWRRSVPSGPRWEESNPRSPTFCTVQVGTRGLYRALGPERPRAGPTNRRKEEDGRSYRVVFRCTCHPRAIDKLFTGLGREVGVTRTR